MITVNVTLEDISKGKPNNDCYCPIALAIYRALNRNPDDSIISVGTETVSIVGITHSLPRKAQEFIYHFDARNPVIPFSFQLDYTP